MCLLVTGGRRRGVGARFILDGLEGCVYTNLVLRSLDVAGNVDKCDSATHESVSPRIRQIDVWLLNVTE